MEQLLTSCQYGNILYKMLQWYIINKQKPWPRYNWVQKFAAHMRHTWVFKKNNNKKTTLMGDLFPFFLMDFPVVLYSGTGTKHVSF